MGTYTYLPVYAGAACDPATAGGQVISLVLYSGPEREGAPSGASISVSRAASGRYVFTIPDGLPDGRYWAVASFIPAQDQPQVADRTVRVDLPTGTGLIASPEQVADKLKTPLPLTAAQRESYRTDIAEAQAAVSAYLGRPLIPAPQFLRSVRPLLGSDLASPDAWPLQEYDDEVTVLGHTVNPDGSYDVQLLVGLEAALEEPIVRYVVAHAAESIRNAPAAGAEGRRVTSVSAEGQSVSYDSAPTAGQAGALPSLDSLSRYRKQLYRPISRTPATPWPYGGRRYLRR
ncbi:hypothetical protein ABT024_05445 [Streptomyces sp. NPDC002812]|uniref:hypothetical protein n=1 Tax=Streptomyces sp. NPDC002812 TaxID=3154434 RepID=UPI00332B7F5A